MRTGCPSGEKARATRSPVSFVEARVLHPRRHVRATRRLVDHGSQRAHDARAAPHLRARRPTLARVRRVTGRCLLRPRRMPNGCAPPRATAPRASSRRSWRKGGPMWHPCERNLLRGSGSAPHGVCARRAILRRARSLQHLEKVPLASFTREHADGLMTKLPVVLRRGT
jgi:hypothetical protein